jgi:hypothetical protein
MKTYIFIDHENSTAFTMISRDDILAYLGENYPTYFIPSTDGIEGEHHVGDGCYVSVVFIDDVAGDKYVRTEGYYSEISAFVGYQDEDNYITYAEDRYGDFGGPEYETEDQREREDMNDAMYRIYDDSEEN